MKKIFFLLLWIGSGALTLGQTTYYSNSSGNLNTLSTWGTNTNGSGANPANFTSANCTYVIVNNTAPSISGNWTVSGTNSKVQVGDGTQAIDFSVPAGKTATAPIDIMATATLTILNNGTVSGTINVTGTLDIQDNTNPTIGTIANGSTVSYSHAGNQTILAMTYYNLSLGGGTGRKALSGTTTVNGALTLGSGTSLRLNTATTSSLIMNGTITGSGTITGNTSAVMSIGGSGTFGTLLFTTGSQAIYSLTMNRGGLGVVTLGNALTIGNAFTQTNGVLDLNDQTLTLNGAITFPVSAANGSFTGSATSTVTIGGTGAITNYMYMTQSGTGNYMGDITLNRSGQSLTAGNLLNVLGTITPTAGIFNANGNTVLLATSATAVGRVGTIGASASVTGNMTVQSYAKGGTTGWTLMSSAGITGRTFADWNDNITITCSTCPNGFWYSFTSVYSYDETAGGVFSNSARYIPITSINDPMNAGKGYWTYLGNSTGTTSDIILDVTGPVNQSSVNFNLTVTNSGGGTNATDHGYNLLANPYPSPILWSSLRNGNVNVANAIYVYNPDLSGYASYVNGISSPATGSGGIGNSIPAGQGFFVKASAATTLTALETYKGASTQQLLRMSGQQVQSTAAPMVMRLKASGRSMQNETAVYFDANATCGYDVEYDATYMAPDAGFVGICTRVNGNEFSINGMPALNGNVSIPVKVTADTTDLYQISASDLQNLPAGACIMLHDNYTNSNKDLRTGAYSCTISDTEKVAARFVLNITLNNNIIVSGSTQDPTCLSSANGSISATGSGSGPWNYYWKDNQNNIIRTSLGKSGSDTLPNVRMGDYSVDVTTTGCNNGSQHFSLQPQQAVVSSFTSSSSNLVFMSDSVGLSFTNTSSNANTYWWDFGDGMGAPDTNTSHYYSGPGDFTVTLYAFNAACGDTSVYKEVINIVDGSVGIAAYAQPTKNMLINRDEKGYYVKFNYTSPVNARIAVQNLYGQEVTESVQAAQVTEDKIYIPIGNTDEQILILSAVTDTNEKTYCKIVNIK
jgi:hypothetical protein